MKPAPNQPSVCSPSSVRSETETQSEPGRCVTRWQISSIVWASGRKSFSVLAMSLIANQFSSWLDTSGIAGLVRPTTRFRATPTIERSSQWRSSRSTVTV